MAFRNLVRFEQTGQAFYGDLLKKEKQDFVVKRLDGNIEDGFKATDEIVRVAQVD